MFGTHDLALFVVTGLLLNITPGQDTLFIVGRSGVGGFRAGAAAALGISAGCLAHVAAAAAGLSAVLSTSAALFTAIKLAGAAYLVWIGLSMMLARDRPRPSGARACADGGVTADDGALFEATSVQPAPFESAPADLTPVDLTPVEATPVEPVPARHGAPVQVVPSVMQMSLQSVFWQGCLTNVLNPKVALFFLALLPQFIDADTTDKAPAFVFLGLVFIANGTVWNLLVAWFAARVAAGLSPGAAVGRWLRRAAGLAFVGLGVRLAFSEAH